MLENNDISNLRKYQRHDIRQSIIVIDTMSGQQVGVLANISEEGLMIAAPSALDTETIYQLRLLLPNKISGADIIDVGVDCLWTHGHESNVNMFWSGCHIIDFSEDSLEILQYLIRDLSEH